MPLHLPRLVRHAIQAWFVWILVCAVGHAQAQGHGPLVTAAWLKAELPRGEITLLDASATPMHRKGHIPGAASADLYAYGIDEPSIEQMTRRVQAWGVSPGRRVVIYDEGGSMMATRLFHDLMHAGVPMQDLAILDGGLAAWRAAGGAVTQETAAPKPGTFRVTAYRSELRVKLEAFLIGSGDPTGHALVEALEPSYYYGETKFFDRGGHVPHAVMLPAEDFYNADKTFKSADEIRLMVAHLGVKPGQKIYTYCGGGVAASVPWFAMKVLLGWPTVQLYRESQLEWLQDERRLPMWTYAAPALQRDADWLNGWTNRMMRMFSVTKQSVIDVRPEAAYRQGHVPYSLNVPAEVFREHLRDPAQLAARLGPAGVNPAHEAVVVSDGGLNPRSALAMLMLERVSQKRVSMLLESVDEWGLRGLPLEKTPTVVGPRTSPMEITIAPVAYPAVVKPGVVAGDPGDAAAAYPVVHLWAGTSAPARAPAGTVVRLAYTELLAAEGRPKPAPELWKILQKAGVPRYARVIAVADDPGEAAVAWAVLRMMGWTDVRVALPGAS